MEVGLRVRLWDRSKAGQGLGVGKVKGWIDDA